MATPISPPSVVDEVVNRIRHGILSGQFKPGERLIEDRLTRMFGVSRPPVREALRILQQTGFVESYSRRGSVVVTLDADDVTEIYTFRWVLERAAIELGVPVANPQLLDPLRAALTEMAIAADDDLDRMVQANFAFHRALVALGGNRRLLQAYDTLTVQLRLCMAFNLTERQLHRDSKQSAYESHRRLLELIESGDRDAVNREIENHGDRSFLRHLDNE